ncbi:MAG: nucleotidyltransferase family protein [Pseudomonadales bacterium]|nr:nucleotidyltransferase family protein [Pseudomonadales bacterium]
MKAMILAAGLGKRMGELGQQRPKPLLEAGGKALIEWQIEKLVAAGVRELVINLHHLGEQIVQRLGDGSRYGAQIVYSHEQQRLETAGGILKALPLLQDECFLVVNADIWTDFDFASLPAVDGNTVLAHLVLVPNSAQHPGGDFYLSTTGRVYAETANATGASSGTATADRRLTFSGISVMHRQLFQGLSLKPQPLLPLLLAASAAQKLQGRFYGGQWQDIGTPERLQQLDTSLRG